MKNIFRKKYAMMITVAIILLAQPNTTNAHTYATGVVEENVNVGWVSTGVALNSHGLAGICYRDETNDAQKYAYQDGGAWRTEMVDDDNGDNDDIGVLCAIVFDENDAPNIVYTNTSDNEIRHAKKDGAVWQIQQVVGNVGTDLLSIDANRISLAKGQNGGLAIAFYDSLGRDLIFAEYDGVNWWPERLLQDGDVGRYASLDFDRNGNPGVAFMEYTDRNTASLKFMQRNDRVWSDAELVDDEAYSGSFSTLKFDSNGIAHISYRVVGNDGFENLKHRMRKDGEWSPAIVFSPSSTNWGIEGAFVSMALDGDGNAFIAQRNFFRHGLFGRNNYLRLTSLYFSDLGPQKARIQRDMLVNTRGFLFDISATSIAIDANYNMTVVWAIQRDANEYALYAATVSTWDPVIALLSPNDDSHEAGDSFKIEWRDFDPDSNAEIKFFYEGNDNGPVEFGRALEDDENEVFFDTSRLPVGGYNITASISDNDFVLAFPDGAPRQLAVGHEAPEPPGLAEPLNGPEVVAWENNMDNDEIFHNMQDQPNDGEEAGPGENAQDNGGGNAQGNGGDDVQIGNDQEEIGGSGNIQDQPDDADDVGQGAIAATNATAPASCSFIPNTQNGTPPMAYLVLIFLTLAITVCFKKILRAPVNY